MQFTNFENGCIDLLLETKSRGKHCFRSAVDHLKKGWALRQIDPNMAVFRAITAEEEAASGLIYVIKERLHIDSEKLDPRSHRHKSAVVPFIQILGMHFKEIVEAHDMQPILHLRAAEGDLPKHLGIGLKVKVAGVEQIAYPIPPLNLRTTISGLVPSYKSQSKELLKEAGAASVKEYISGLANLRNKILYSSADGIPTIEDLADDFFINRKKRVMAMLNAYLFIEPYEEIQPFVQDAVHAFVAMLEMKQSIQLYTET